MRPDADFDFAVANIVDGAFYNSGQCCCGIERIYVHERLYDRFVEAFADRRPATPRQSARSRDDARPHGGHPIRERVRDHTARPWPKALRR